MTTLRVINKRETEETENRISNTEDQGHCHRIEDQKASTTGRTGDNRNRRNNIKIIGIPENTTGRNAIDFIKKNELHSFLEQSPFRALTHL